MLRCQAETHSISDFVGQLIGHRKILTYFIMTGLHYRDYHDGHKGLPAQYLVALLFPPDPKFLVIYRSKGRRA